MEDLAASGGEKAHSSLIFHPLFACCWPCCPVIYKLSSNDWLSGWQAESSLLQEAEDSDANIFFFPHQQNPKGPFPFDVHPCFLMSNLIPHHLLHLLEETHAVQPATGGMKILIISKLKLRSRLFLFTLTNSKKARFSFFNFIL